MTTTADIRKTIANEALEVARKATVLRRRLGKVGWNEEVDPALNTEVREFLNEHAARHVEIGILAEKRALTEISLDYYEIFTSHHDN